MTLGAMLRQARVAKGLTCDDVSRVTRIPARVIAAMEREDWAKVPGGIFTRGYLRAYAGEVGLDATALLAQYAAEHPPRPEPAPETSAADESWHITIRAPRWGDDGVAWRRFGWPALAAVVLTLYFAAGRIPAVRNEAPGTAAGPPGAAEADRSTATPASALGGAPEVPVATTAAAADVEPQGGAPPAASAVDAPLSMDLAVTRPCWLTLTVDGRRAIYRLVRPGERERQQGREFVIRAGDAGALQLSVDGEAARPLGASGAVVTVRITRANYRSVLPSSSGASSGSS